MKSQLIEKDLKKKKLCSLNCHIHLPNVKMIAVGENQQRLTEAVSN